MSAPPELKLRTVFEEGFGLVGGALGTMFGSSAAAAGIGLMTLCGLCIGPFGAFVLIFICASAGGIVGMETFKWGGGRIYDASDNLGGRIYNSFDELVGALQ